MIKDNSRRVLLAVLLACCVAIALVCTWRIREKDNNPNANEISEYNESGEDVEENTYNFGETKKDFNLEIEQVYVLKKSNEYFQNIYLGEDLAAAVERTKVEPERIEDFDGNIALTWKVEPIGGVNVLVVNNKILRKERLMYSNSIKGVSFSKEIETEIEDLKELEGNLKRGMTLEEVAAILGDKYIITFEDAEGYKYMWYDKKEQYIEIYFTKTNEGEKVDFIGSCYASD